MNHERINNRINSVRVYVQQMITSIPNEIRRQEASVQLNGVSTFASMLAMRRGYNRELAGIAGLLHNYYYYKTGIKDFAGINSAEAVRPWIRDMNIFTKEEQLVIQQAIYYREDRSRIHGSYDEIVKDAYVLQSHFQNSDSYREDAFRLRVLLRELGIPEEIEEGEPGSDRAEFIPVTDRRSKLADIAEALAGESVIGVPGNEQYREICRYWPDPDIYKVLQNSWCAAFVYHCCRQAGLLMPIRYPNGIHRLAGVGAWLEWAQLPETGFFYYDGQNGFTPQRGDIVIYEKLLSDNSHDHIGIVLDCDEQEIVVAEGNRDNQNYSCVFRRDRRHCILGYIRIADDYQFHFSGSYNPIL